MNSYSFFAKAFGTVILLALFINSLSAQSGSAQLDANFSLVSKVNLKKKPSSTTPIPLDDPITLKRNGKCFQIWCAEGEGCDHCTLYWKDQNGDGEINPKRELRCRCDNDPKKECKKKWKQVPCSGQ